MVFVHVAFIGFSGGFHFTTDWAMVHWTIGKVLALEMASNIVLSLVLVLGAQSASVHDLAQGVGEGLHVGVHLSAHGGT